jgi:uroporphyrinogen decarboxylase
MVGLVEMALSRRLRRTNDRHGENTGCAWRLVPPAVGGSVLTLLSLHSAGCQFRGTLETMGNEQTVAKPQAISKALYDSIFMKACRGEATDTTPIWLMRQAGRFQPEYRAIREKLSFLELCKKSETAAEVTVFAVESLGVDAAIIFADILLPLEPMGVGLEYAKGDGPVIHRPVRSNEDVRGLKDFDVAQELQYVMRSIEIARRELKPNIPLIGFAGAPFTLASYMIEGGSSRHFENTKKLMYGEPQTWHALMEKLAHMTAAYLNAQINAGAQAVQLFDSWVGCLGQDDYERFVLPHVKRTISGIVPGVPVIHFGTGNPALLPLQKQAGSTVMGVDWRIELDRAWEQLPDVAVQGNLDPITLLSNAATIEDRSGEILRKVNDRPGHIFNLGHGILPPTPVDNVRRLVEFVHQWRRS